MADYKSDLFPNSLRKKGEDSLLIDWNDGHAGLLGWKHLRSNCPCATCGDEREKPANPFHILKPSELVQPAPKSLVPVGHYAYRIVWNDGHDSGIYTLESLRALCQCEKCLSEKTKT